MTQSERIEYFGIAASLVGYKFEKQALELLVSVYDKILDKKGDTDLKDLVDIQISVERKYKEIEMENKKPLRP
jgi:hypothetical protein